MKNIYKYFGLLAILFGFVACEVDEIEPNLPPEPAALPALNVGSLDFSSYVSLGASFTAGFTDGALFQASQENSFPNIIAQLTSANGGDFTQPLMDDNIGGLLFGGAVAPDFLPRLYFFSDQDGEDPNLSGPNRLGIDPLDDLSQLAVPTTDVFDVMPGPYSNMGVPGAKSFHLLFDGYGNQAGLLADPATANPYFVRMASSSSATMLDDAMDQTPTFFTLSEIGGNDVLGYATSGGDGTNPITPSAGPPGVGFDATFGALVATLTGEGAKGAVTNVPYITDLPHFTSVPFNALDPSNPALAPQIDALNAQLYGPLDGIFTAFGEPDRINILSATAANPVLINDENAIDRSAEITGALTPVLGAQTAAAFGAIFGKARQATASDLLVLPSSSVIATEVPGVPAPANVNGVSFPLADKWVLIPEEQTAIRNATDAYNMTIEAVVSANPNVVLVDLNSVLTQASDTGVTFDDFKLTTDLVFGGLVSLDGIHLTSRGYALMANKFLEALDASFGSNFVEAGVTAKAVNYGTNYPAILP